MNATTAAVGRPRRTAHAAQLLCNAFHCTFARRRPIDQPATDFAFISAVWPSSAVAACAGDCY